MRILIHFLHTLRYDKTIKISKADHDIKKEYVVDSDNSAVSWRM